MGGVEYEDEFYRQILDKIVVGSQGGMDVYLNMLPVKWSYKAVETSKRH